MRSSLMLRLLCLASFMLWLTAPALARCNGGKVELPDLTTLKLSEGEHVIATLETIRGKMEVRVTVKGKDISEPSYFIGGKRLEETPKAKVEKGNRSCLKTSSADDNFTSWYAVAARAVLDSIVTPAQAKQCKARVVSVSCTSERPDGENQCCAMARCGNFYAVRCAYY